MPCLKLQIGLATQKCKVDLVSWTKRILSISETGEIPEALVAPGFFGTECRHSHAPHVGMFSEGVDVRSCKTSLMNN